MANMIKVEHINPFLASAATILDQVCQMKISAGKVSLDNAFIDGEPIFIMLGVTGEMTGQVFMVFGVDVAKQIASRMMMGMPVDVIDDMAKSALSELGNMIMGNAATILSNDKILIDITPPALGTGSVKMTSPNMKSIKVPLICEGKELMSMYFLLKFV